MLLWKEKGGRSRTGSVMDGCRVITASVTDASQGSRTDYEQWPGFEGLRVTGNTLTTTVHHLSSSAFSYLLVPLKTRRSPKPHVALFLFLSARAPAVWEDVQTVAHSSSLVFSPHRDPSRPDGLGPGLTVY